MNDAQIGRSVRVVRIQLGWRQRDLAVQARVSQQVVSKFELGHIDGMSLGSIRRIVRAVDGNLGLTFRWRGAMLDRILDERHAILTSQVKRVLERAGWLVELEVSYSEFAERGSIDLMAFHAATRTLLIVEVKTELGSVEATLRKHDEKVRLGPGIARRTFGWSPRTVGRILVLPDARTPRRQIARFADIFEGSYPVRGRGARRWLREPSGSIRGLVFLSPTPTSGGRRSSVGVRRVRSSRPCDATHGPASALFQEGDSGRRTGPNTTGTSR